MNKKPPKSEIKRHTELAIAYENKKPKYLFHRAEHDSPKSKYLTLPPCFFLITMSNSLEITSGYFFILNNCKK